MKEKDIQRQIIDYLELKGWLVIKINNVGIRKENGSYIPPREKGISDLICCDPYGRFIAIEVKKPGNTLSDYQAIFLDRVRSVKGRAIIAYSLDDVIKEIESWINAVS